MEQVYFYFLNSNHNIIFELALINCIKVNHLSNLYELIILALGFK